MTTKAKAKKKTVKSAKAAETKKQPSRREQIEGLLAKSREPRTNQEICKALHLPKEDAKFVASIMVAEAKKKRVAAKKKACSITGRTVKAWSLRKGA